MQLFSRLAINSTIRRVESGERCADSEEALQTEQIRFEFALPKRREATKCRRFRAAAAAAAGYKNLGNKFWRLDISLGINQNMTICRTFHCLPF